MNKHTAEMIELAKEGLQIHRESNPEYKICAEVLRLNSLNAELLEALTAIRQYGLDTLSGRDDGGTDDRDFQRDAVREMSKRAIEAIKQATGDSE